MPNDTPNPNPNRLIPRERIVHHPACKRRDCRAGSLGEMATRTAKGYIQCPQCWRLVERDRARFEARRAAEKAAREALAAGEQLASERGGMMIVHDRAEGGNL